MIDPKRFKTVRNINKYGFVIPTPNAGDTKDEYIGRCMGNPTMNSEFPEQDQRYAVCISQWEDK